MNCPCGSGQIFELCCDRFIAHRELPENAALLMRSRYCAFAPGEAAYLLQTLHPDFRPPQLQLDPGIRWIGLEITHTGQHRRRARVEF